MFADADLPLLRINAQREYNIHDVEHKLKTFIKEQVKSPTTKSETENHQTENAVPMRLKCNILMVVRTVSKGEHKGKQFMAARTFPNVEK